MQVRVQRRGIRRRSVDSIMTTQYLICDMMLMSSLFLFILVMVSAAVAAPSSSTTAIKTSPSAPFGRTGISNGWSQDKVLARSEITGMGDGQTRSVSSTSHDLESNTDQSFVIDMILMEVPPVRRGGGL